MLTHDQGIDDSAGLLVDLKVIARDWWSSSLAVVTTTTGSLTLRPQDR